MAVYKQNYRENYKENFGRLRERGLEIISSFDELYGS
jgi:hypothetical protein